MATEKWERNKRHLSRNLLVDPGYLSPVTEGSLSNNLVDSPFSPLPDLATEAEPNRLDDPPEFYQELEMRMRSLYKRLFVEDRERSAETEDLINENEEISTFDKNQITPSTFSHHREDDWATFADSETLNPTNIFKEIQNVSKSVESKDMLSKVEFVKSPIISLGSRACSAGNGTNETNWTKTDLGFTRIISTARDYTKELKEMLNISHRSQANTENESAPDETVENTIRSNVPRRKRSRDADSDTDNSFEVALRRSAFDRVNKRRTSKRSSDAELKTEDGSLTSEERIDSNDDDDQSIIKGSQHDDEYSENDSFEMPLRRQLFETINRSKGFGRAPEELDSASDETEATEEMRGAPQVEALQAFRRKSTVSQKSLQSTFAKPSVAEISEDISMDLAGHSIATLNRTQDEGSLQGSVAQDRAVLSGFTARTHTDVHFQEDSISNMEHVTSMESLQVQNSSQEESMEQKSPVEKRSSLSSNKPIKSFPTEVKQSSIGSEEATPSTPGPGNNLISTSFWSVSPIATSPADFLNATTVNEASNENLTAKRRSSKKTKRNESSSGVPKKRKKYQNQFVQARLQIDQWENMKANFFVGTPRIFKVCSCSDYRVSLCNLRRKK